MANGNRSFTIDLKTKLTDKSGIEELKSMLLAVDASVQSKSIAKGKMSSELKESLVAAQSLRSVLEQSWNSNIGQLDLGKLKNNIDSTFGSVEKLKTSLSNEGIRGANAYNQFAREVLNTNIQLKTSSKLLNEMATTLSNTVKWGISSSIVNNMSGSIQKAWSFAKDLDESLNSIRIVSGKSADEMARFAVEANKAAKSLGATTLDYTEAALIYEQQGLGTEEVAARTETTLKMANVLGESADAVSDYMTAIWNNFAEGADNLEYYGDVITALGAATASSSDEIAAGLEKFSSVAETIGLSYEYATSALATVTATTRQSADVVGTAFKTLFSRIQGLSLGETLDDGTTLNKYSQALEAVGINIKDQNGQLKDMDQILNEMGSKWGTLAKDQKVALAQTVAGVRQYNQLMSLMDNWDFFQENLVTAYESTGTLAKQQEIYMDSLEAKMNTLRAEMEKTWNTLFDEDTAKGFIDVLTTGLKGFNTLITGMGGGFNTFLTGGMLLANQFSNSIGRSFERRIENREANRSNLTGQQLKQQVLDAGLASGRENSGTANTALQEQMNLTQRILNLTGELTQEQASQLTQAQAEIGKIDQRIEGIKEYKQIYAELNNMNLSSVPETMDFDDFLDKFQMMAEEESRKISAANDIIAQNKILIEKFNNAVRNGEVLDDDTNMSLFGIIQDAQADIDSQQRKRNKLSDRKVSETHKDSTYKKEMKNIAAIQEKMNNQQVLSEQDISVLLAAQTRSRKESIQHIARINQGINGVKDAEGNLLPTLELQSAERKKSADETLTQYERQKVLSEGFSSFTSIIGGLSGAIGLLSTATNENLTSWEKFSALLVAAPITIMQLFKGFSSISSILPAMAVGLGAVGKAEDYTAKSALKAQIAVLGLKISLGEFLLIGAAVAAIIGTLVIVGRSLVDAYNADARAATDASEAAKELEDNYKTLKTSAQELKDTITGYEDAKKDLKDLTVGTDEYTEALKGANEKAKELIETFGLYNDYTIKDGMIEINQQALEKAQKEANALANNAEQRMYSAKIRSNNANLKSSRTDFSREIGFTSTVESMSRENPEDRLITLTDEAIKTIVEKISNNSKALTDLETGNKDAIRDFINNIDGLSDESKLLTDRIVNESDKLKDLVKATQEAADANKYYAEQKNKAAIESEYGEQLKAMATDKDGTFNEARYNQLIELVNKSDAQQNTIDLVQKRLDKWEDTDWNKAGDKYTSQEAWSNEFAQRGAHLFSDKGDLNKVLTDDLTNLLGATGDQLKELIGRTSIDSNKALAEAIAKLNGIDINGATWKGNKFINGDQTLVDVSSKEARGSARAQIFNAVNEKVATDQAQNIAKTDTNNYLDFLNELQKNAKNFGEKYGTDFSGAMLNSMVNGTKTFDFSALFNDISPTEFIQLQEMQPDELMKNLGLSEDDVIRMGYEPGEEFAKAFRAGFVGYEWNMDDAITNVIEKNTDALKDAGINEEEIEDYTKQIMLMANEDERLADSLGENADVAFKVAKNIMRMNDGIEELGKNWKNWNDILKKSSKTSEEYATALGGMRKSLSKILDVDESAFQNEFIIDNLDEISKAADGDEEAIERLRASLQDSIIANVFLNNNDLSPERIEELKSNFNDLENSLNDIEVGVTLNGDNELLQQLQQVIDAAGMTEEQANNYLQSIGMEPVFEKEEKEITQQVPEYAATLGLTQKEVDMGPLGKHNISVPALKISQTGTVPMTTTAEVAAISSNGKTPKIKSLTKTGGKGTAKYNNYSSANKGGPSSPKSGGSGKQADRMDAVEDAIDRYHDVNIALEQISTTLERLQKQQDKLFGQDLIDNLNKQLAILNRQIDKTNEKIQIARGEMRELQGTLSGKGVTFNSDGTIANYAAAYKAQLAYVNSLISKYNAMSAEAQEGYKDTVEQAKKDFDKFVEDLKRYDELVANEIPSLEDEIQDAINEQIEIQIQKFNMEIEIRLDLAEATKEWNDFKRTIIDGIKEDDILGTAASKLNDYNIYYNQSGNGIVQAGTRHVNEVLEQLRQMDATGSSNVYGDNRTQALEDLQTYYEQLMSDLEEVDELIQEIEDSYLDLMDEAQEKFDEQIENFEAIGDQLEHDIKLVQLLRGLDDFANTDMYELVDKYYAQQNENYQQQIKFQSSQVEFWKQQMDNAEYASDEWESAREKWMDATSELNSLVESSIDMLQDKYLNMIDSIFDKLNKSITNDFGLDYVSEQWDLINQNADQYLDTINRAYGIQELQNKYLDAIDNTDSISAQQKINELMNSEIQALQNKDKLTQYDLDRAEKKYNLMLKQIALEEAQQNKTKLRLKRDSQGNYTYQYVADEDEISKLKDEIAALYNELYNFDLDRYKENVKQAYDVWEEMQSKVYEIYQDTTLTEEERQRKIALIQEQYGELINGIIAENEVVRFNLQESTYLSLDNLYGENITHYEAMTDAQREITNMLIGDSIEAYNAMSEEQKAIISDLCGFTLSEFEAMSDDEKRIYLDLLLGYQNMADTEKEILEGQIVPQWNSSMQDMINSISGAGGFENVCKDTFTNLETQLKEFNANVGTTLKSASIDMQQLKGATDPAVTSMQNMVTAAGNLTDAYGDQLAQCANVIQQLGQLKTAYDNAASAAKAAATEAYNYWAAAQNKAANAAQQSNQSSSNSSNSSNSSQNSNPQGNGRIDVGDVVTYTGGYYYAASDGSGARGNRGPGRQVTVTQVRNGARYPIHVRSGNSAYGWLTSSQISGYDTGGYTGDWNDNSGRLALLHQKELVLNEEDTKNMLAAVEVIRAITSSIDNNMLNKLATLNASSLGFNMEGETIEQNVHIEATFPNVKDSHEVEDALKNLVNTASQRVYSNKK